ncbi:MAG: hypothetical protein KGO02_01630 [Alphaproteobacteria bacterium]|nr:hypothetical protein [Alphaproteobacteria bacterium]
MADANVTGRLTHHTDTPALTALIRTFGVVWLFNAAWQGEAWLVSRSAARNLLHALAHPAAQAPSWLKPPLLAVLKGVTATGPRPFAAVMVAIAILLGVALLSGVALEATAGIGLIYSLICWLVLNGMGFPYAHGQTDPGVFVAYAITFLFVLAAGSSLRATRPEAIRRSDALWNYARLAFALLWLFDAALKWLPAFLFHFTSQITGVISGQPHPVAIWLGFVAAVIGVIGPVTVAVLVAIAETVIALSLLTGRGLKVVLPLGILYSLSVWATAEAFGGPYTAAGTGVRGNVLGNVIIYLLPFLFLWVRARTSSLQPRP